MKISQETVSLVTSQLTASLVMSSAYINIVELLLCISSLLTFKLTNIVCVIHDMIQRDLCISLLATVQSNFSFVQLICAQ